MKTGSYLYPFQIHIPTKIRFGNGILEEAIRQETADFSGKIMVITTGNDMQRLGYLDRVINQLPNPGTCIVFDKISSNPKSHEVSMAIQLGIEEGVTMMIGLGGGSAIDAAKAASIGIGTGSDDLIPYLLGEKSPPPETLPIIAIPTTAGTGTELSKGSILTFTEYKIKTGIRGDYLFPRIAIVDPELTLSIPLRVTIETGFDALTHAIETYISKQANVFTEMLSLEAIKLISNWLPQLVNDINNKEARKYMSFASMIMGINLSISSTCLPHRMQYAVGALTDTSHSVGLACLYPSWLSIGYSASPEKFDHIGELLSTEICQGETSLSVTFSNFMNRIDYHVTLTELGLCRDQLDILCNKVSGNMNNDPVFIIPNVVRQIFEGSF